LGVWGGYTHSCARVNQMLLGCQMFRETLLRNVAKKVYNLNSKGWYHFIWLFIKLLHFGIKLKYVYMGWNIMIMNQSNSSLATKKNILVAVKEHYNLLKGFVWLDLSINM